jgi:hypothetical protein
MSAERSIPVTPLKRRRDRMLCCQKILLRFYLLRVLFVEVLVPHEPAIGDQFCGIQVLLNSEKCNRSPELWAAKTTRSQIVIKSTCLEIADQFPINGN